VRSESHRKSEIRRNESGDNHHHQGRAGATVEALGRDKPFLSPRVTEIIMRELAKDAAKGPSLADLTTREKEVLHLLAEGKGNKEVADVLGISFRTAEAHHASLMRKLNLRSMSDLVRFAIRHRIVEV
jgi:two-component system response regulator NreC